MWVQPIADQTRLKIKPQFASRVPWDVIVAKNQVLNRLMIDILGMEVPSIGLARNNFERIEKGFDFAFRLVIGFGLPVLSGMLINRYAKGQILRHFLAAFKNKKTAAPLELPFELLGKRGFNGSLNLSQKSLINSSGIRSLNVLTPDLKRKILNAKLAIVAVDMVVMASKGQFYFWFKNWFTKKYSGKSGFSGEFNIADDQHLKEKSQGYEKNKAKRHLMAAIVGYSGALSLPLALKFALSLRGNNTLARGLRKLVPLFNYTNTVYLSKWVLLWHAIFNWDIAGAITARDSHERREHLIKTITANFFFLLGDDMISGIVAKALQQKNSKLLKMTKAGKTVPINLVEKQVLGWPVAMTYHSLLQNITVGPFRLASPKVKQALMQIGRLQFWAGLLGTSMGLGVFMTLFNNYLTQKKVQKELAQKQQQEALKLQQEQAVRQKQQADWQQRNNYAQFGLYPA